MIAAQIHRALGLALILTALAGLAAAQVARGVWADPLLSTDDEARRQYQEAYAALTGPGAEPVFEPRPLEPTISITSLEAPPKARKAYEKAGQLAARGKLEESEKQLQQAIEIYPDFAEAWHGLGLVRLRQKRFLHARGAFLKALAVDPKYWKPYAELAQLALAERKFQDAVDTTAKGIQINPTTSPSLYLYNAMGNYLLGQWVAAGDSAREALRLDKNDQWPKAHHVLGLALAEQGDPARAAAELRAYLQLAPKAYDAEIVLQQIEKIESSAQTASAGQ